MTDAMTEGRWWWLSFVDTSRPYEPENDYPGGPRHLGVCIVFAPMFELAVAAAHYHRCNPGGQVAGWDFPAMTSVPSHRVNVLLTGDEMRAASEESVHWVPAYVEEEGKSMPDPKQPEPEESDSELAEPGPDASRQAPEPPPKDTGGKKDWH
jgi:hypothetical protein